MYTRRQVSQVAFIKIIRTRNIATFRFRKRNRFIAMFIWRGIRLYEHAIDGNYVLRHIVTRQEKEYNIESIETSIGDSFLSRRSVLFFF